MYSEDNIGKMLSQLNHNLLYLYKDLPKNKTEDTQGHPSKYVGVLFPDQLTKISHIQNILLVTFQHFSLQNVSFGISEEKQCPTYPLVKF